ncbi:response regulator [Marinisporobacter balticus]|uniref:Stage 0 sporulation protein A homolog n=1 Tax=Marinisporobacter balticus TaxID=2018667 RepID=A0A4R2KSR3_9FIRM|nr:response regulator [Marinisporobacter balticus]TCO77411.1 two-component system response regulator YesN [Marinisporobacter balticus]
MYSVMIVDDEHIIRKGLINFIKWQELNCKVIYEASDGVTAKKLIHSEKPDIIISDIKMPGLDGIQLSQYIYENHPNIKVILLTGYSDFNYAQAAIQYNVVDFVLKPSSTEKIIEAVNKAKTLIIKEKAKEEKLIQLENNVKETLAQMQEKFILDYINGVFIDNSTILNKMNDLKIDLHHFYVLVFKIDKMKYISNGQNMIIEIKKFISMIFKNYKHYPIILDGQSLCIILSFDHSNHSNHSEYIHPIWSKSQEILSFVNDFMNMSISIGISNPHANFLQIPTGYNEAFQCLREKFYDKNNIFMYSHYCETRSTCKETPINKYIHQIMHFVKLGKTNESMDTLHQLLEELQLSKQSIDHIKTTSIRISSLCSTLLDTYNITFSDVLQNSDNLYQQILQCESISKLSSILETVIQSTASSLNTIDVYDHYLIKKAIDYIKKNYHHPIKLKVLAKHLHINGSYLSRLFKQETGETLTQMITKMRIKKAQDLLSSNDLKTYEVAIMVGIEDPAYFSQIFKKHTGVCPSEYKNNM